MKAYGAYYREKKEKLVKGMNWNVKWSFFGKDISNNPKMLTLTGWLFLFGSVIWLTIGGFFTVSRLIFLPGTLSTNGTIISCQSDDKTCSPTVSFVTQSGQKITFVVSSSSSSYREGDTLPVRYHPNSPQDARLDDFLTTWLPLLMGSGGFLLFLFAGLYTFRRGIKLREEQGTLNAIPSPFARELAEDTIQSD